MKKLKRDHDFEASLNSVEKETWMPLQKIVTEFLRKAETYEETVLEFLYNYKALGCNMLLNIYFLYSHRLFPENLVVSDKHGE